MNNLKNLNINELTLVIPDIDNNIFNLIKKDLDKTTLEYKEIGLIEGHGIISINSIYMAPKIEAINYIQSINYILNRWKEYEPYLEEGGIT